MVKPEQTSRQIGLHSTLNSTGCANGLLETNISPIPIPRVINNIAEGAIVAAEPEITSAEPEIAAIEPAIAAAEPATVAADDAPAHQFHAAVPYASDEQVNRSGSAHTTVNLTWTSSEPIPIDTQTRLMLESILRQIEADEKIEAEKSDHTNKN